MGKIDRIFTHRRNNIYKSLHNLYLKNRSINAGSTLHPSYLLSLLTNRVLDQPWSGTGCRRTAGPRRRRVWTSTRDWWWSCRRSWRPACRLPCRARIRSRGRRRWLAPPNAPSAGYPETRAPAGFCKVECGTGAVDCCIIGIGEFVKGFTW